MAARTLFPKPVTFGGHPVSPQAQPRAPHCCRRLRPCDTAVPLRPGAERTDRVRRLVRHSAKL